MCVCARPRQGTARRVRPWVACRGRGPRSPGWCRRRAPAHAGRCRPAAGQKQRVPMMRRGPKLLTGAGQSPARRLNMGTDLAGVLALEQIRRVLPGVGSSSIIPSAARGEAGRAAHDTRHTGHVRTKLSFSATPSCRAALMKARMFSPTHRREASQSGSGQPATTDCRRIATTRYTTCTWCNS